MHGLPSKNIRNSLAVSVMLGTCISCSGLNINLGIVCMTNEAAQMRIQFLTIQNNLAGMHVFDRGKWHGKVSRILDADHQFRTTPRATSRTAPMAFAPSDTKACCPILMCSCTLILTIATCSVRFLEGFHVGGDSGHLCRVQGPREQPGHGWHGILDPGLDLIEILARRFSLQ